MDDGVSSEGYEATLFRAVARKRRRARLVMLFEQVWLAVWPGLGVIGVYLCAGLLGLPQLLPPWPRLALLICVMLAAIVLLGRGLRRVRKPSPDAVDRRLETMSGLRHLPLQVIADRPETANPVTLALWKAHKAAALWRLPQLRVGMPHPGLAARDRRGLRGLLLVGLAACLVVAWADAPRRVGSALLPPLPGLETGPKVEVVAWVTPPPYAQKAPFFVHGEAFSVPEGASLAINVTGESAPPLLTADGAALPFQRLDKSSWQITAQPKRGGEIRVSAGSRNTAVWQVKVEAAGKPEVTWAAPPGAKGVRAELPWQVTDKYGATGLKVEFRLQERLDLPPVTIGIGLPPGVPKTAKGTALVDLTASPWAGLPVTARLVATNIAGKTGASDDALLALPERVFKNPIAQMVIAVRKGLAVHPDDRVSAVQGLIEARHLYAQGEMRSGAFVNLVAATQLLMRERDPAVASEAQARLWRLALELEEGNTAVTRESLEEARQAVKDAMARVRQDPSDANKQALHDALSALRQAVHDHMQALMQGQAIQPMDQNTQRLSEQGLQRREEQAEQALREGRLEDAEKQLEALDKSLQRLQSARPSTEAERKARRERAERRTEQVGIIEDLVQRETGLLGLAQAPPGSRAQPGKKLPQEQRADEAKIQVALRRALGVLLEVAGDSGKIPEGLGNADIAMREAAGALDAGRDDLAAVAEQKAIEALQQGGRSMAQQNQGQQGGDGEAGTELEIGQGDDGTGDGGEGQRADGKGQDPFGRSDSADGQGGEAQDGVKLPEEWERQQAHSIQEELRRRDGEKTRPVPELDYIERLLKGD